MTKEEFLQRLESDEEYSPGWQAIDDAFELLYPGQQPKHFGTQLHSRAIWGGDNYLDGYSIYESPKGFKHIVTYGMTVLYGDAEAFGGEWNGSSLHIGSDSLITALLIVEDTEAQPQKSVYGKTEAYESRWKFGISNRYET